MHNDTSLLHTPNVLLSILSQDSRRLSPVKLSAQNENITNETVTSSLPDNDNDGVAGCGVSINPKNIPICSVKDNNLLVVFQNVVNALKDN